MENSGVSQATSEKASLPLTFLSACREGECTALCLELDIASCGPTLEEAEESLKHLVALYVTDCLEGGETAIPLRPVPLEALLEFLAPSGVQQELDLTSRRLSVAVHAGA